MLLMRTDCWIIGLPQVVPQPQTLITEIIFNLPQGQMAGYDISKRTKPPPPSWMHLRKELCTHKPTLPEELAHIRVVRPFGSIRGSSLNEFCA